jgi:hypothetical protein
VLQSSLQKWRELCKVTVPGMRCCAHCGITRLGNESSINAGKFLEASEGQVPPYAFCAPHMRQHMMDSRERWWTCVKCIEDPVWSAPYRALMELAYLQALLAIFPAHAQLLSVVDIALIYLNSLLITLFMHT